jgi:PEP-CTERM motif-containing protein
MRSRAFRPIAAILSVLFLAGSPVHAGPVAISEVIQVIASYQNPPDLRLRNVSQTGNTAMPGASRSTSATSSGKQSAVDGSIDISDTSAASPSSSDSLLAGVASGSDEGTVDIIDQGDVEGTVCDCGEITVSGGFPKWPLLFLAAIPFFFIHDCDDCETPSVTPTPTPTPTPETPIPEPASLLLFGSGLAAFGAGFRRRYAKAKLAAQVQTTEEG